MCDNYHCVPARKSVTNRGFNEKHIISRKRNSQGLFLFLDMGAEPSGLLITCHAIPVYSAGNIAVRGGDIDIAPEVLYDEGVLAESVG